MTNLWKHTKVVKEHVKVEKVVMSRDMVTRPKQKGGLGILDVSLHNKALMMKNIQKFLNKEPLPWVSLIWEKYYTNHPPGVKIEGSSWWKNHLKLLPLYKQNATCQLGNGGTNLLWHDNWCGQPVRQMFPQLHSFVINDNQTVASWINSKDSSQFFHTPLLAQAYSQFTELQNLIDQKR